MIRAGTRLEVQALSAERKPLNLDGVLIDYDSDGFLYRGQTSQNSPESAYYVPRNAVAFMKFNVDALQQRGVHYTVDYSGESDIRTILKDFREQAGLTKQEVSNLAKISYRSVNYSEDTKQDLKVSSEMIRKILSLYDVQPPEAMEEIERLLQ